MAETIHKNGLLIEAIARENFVCPKLTALKNDDHKVRNAALALKKLGTLFSSLDSALNPMGMILANGSVMLLVGSFIIGAVAGAEDAAVEEQRRGAADDQEEAEEEEQLGEEPADRKSVV